jgi:hypothetical protein
MPSRARFFGQVLVDAGLLERRRQQRAWCVHWGKQSPGRLIWLSAFRLRLHSHHLASSPLGAPTHFMSISQQRPILGLARIGRHRHGNIADLLKFRGVGTS